MILTHFIAFDFWPGAGVSDTPEPTPDPTGGGGGRRKFKSYDQRQRERQEQLDRDAAARKAKYGTLPKGLEDALKPAPSPYKRLAPAQVKAYANAAQNDDEDAMSLIMSLL